MRVRRFIIALLAGPTTVMAMLIAYASMNSILWNQFHAFVLRNRQGTTIRNDLTSWAHDLGDAFGTDYIHVNYDPVDDRFARLLFGLRIDADIFRINNGFGLYHVLVFIAAMSIVMFFVPMVATRFSASKRSTGLSESFFEEAETRRRLIKIQFLAILIALASGPLLAIVSWYITYDRIQSSFDLPSGKTRWARYVTDSFSPQLGEWPFLLLLPMLIAFLYVFIRSKRFIKNLPPETRVAHQRNCPNRRCRYQLDPNITTCSECGLHWKESITNPLFDQPKHSRKKLTLVALIIILIPTITVSVISRTQRYQLYNWITLRHDRYLTQNLYLIPSRPVRLQWGSDTLWIMTMEIPIDPNLSPACVIYQINDEPLRMIVDDVKPYTQFITLDSKRVLDPSPYHDWWNSHWRGPNYTTMHVYALPDAVLGFPEEHPLTPEAQSFLDRAAALESSQR